MLYTNWRTDRNT